MNVSFQYTLIQMMYIRTSPDMNKKLNESHTIPDSIFAETLNTAMKRWNWLGIFDIIGLSLR